MGTTVVHLLMLCFKSSISRHSPAFAHILNRLQVLSSAGESGLMVKNNACFIVFI